MRKHARPVLTAAMLIAASSQAWAAGANDTALPKATSDFLQVYPGVQAHMQQGQVRILYGKPMGGGVSAQASATDWLVQNGTAFGDGALQLQQVWSSSVMNGKFTVFAYNQFIDGYPVELGIARVLVLNTPTNPVVYAAGNLAARPEGGFPKPILAAENALQIAQDAKESEGLKNWSASTLTVFHGNGDWTTPVLTWKVTGQGDLNNVKTFFVNASTGQVVFVRDEISTIDVNGTVKGWASSGLYPPDATYAVAALSLQGIPEIKAAISGGNNAFADRTGTFTITNSGSTAVTVNSGTNGATDGFGGRWVSVVPNDGATRQTASQSVTPPGPASLVLNPTGTANPAGNAAIAPLTAQVNAAIVIDVTHDYFKDRAPSFTPLDIVIPANTGVAGTCNAFFNGSSVNFYNAGGGCSNTAYTTVMSHEYGHFIVQSLGLAQNSFGEGYGDTNAAMIWNDGITGRGFLGTQGSNVRDPVGANIQYPCSGSCGGEIHCCGQQIAASWWQIRTAYGTLLGDPAGLELARSEEVAWSLITMGGPDATDSAGPSTAIEVLTVDDNDGDLSNGTPHYTQICPVFASHSISCPTITLLSFQYPSGRPTSATPGAPTTIAVNVVGNSGSPQPGTGTVSYRLGTTGTFTTVAMAQGAPNQYTATLPAINCGQNLQYYFGAQTTTATTVTDPSNAPASTFALDALAGASSTTVVDLNMDTDPGWTVTNTAITTGAWQRAVPVSPTPPEAPPTGFGGSGQCWVTDNRADTASGNFDVDGGPTVLTTTTFDLSSYADADISYARWIESVNGVTDSLVIQVSNNNGSTWTTVETVPSTIGWVLHTFRLSSFTTPTSQVKVRFSVSDNPSDSVTEAGIDSFKIVGYTCGGQACYANCDSSTSAPILNVADFTCFLQRYAANDPYANCDASSTPPVLNVADFTCFLQKYAAGCP